MGFSDKKTLLMEFKVLIKILWFNFICSQLRGKFGQKNGDNFYILSNDTLIFRGKFLLEIILKKMHLIFRNYAETFKVMMQNSIIFSLLFI